MTYNEKPENFAKFEELGVRVMSFTLTSDCSLSESWSAPVAVAPGKYDYSDLDARIEGVLKAAPNAWLLPRVYRGLDRLFVIQLEHLRQHRPVALLGLRPLSLHELAGRLPLRRVSG